MKRTAIFLVVALLQLGNITSLKKNIKHGTDGRSIMDKISFGKNWFVYVKAHVYNVLNYSACNQRTCSSAYLISMRKLRRKISEALYRYHPCYRVVNAHIWRGITESGLAFHTRSKLCADIRLIYGYPPARLTWHNLEKFYDFRYFISVNKMFRINVTIMSLEVQRYFPLCQTLRAMLVQQYRSGLGVLGEFCPGNPPKSFYSNVELVFIFIYSASSYHNMFLQTTHTERPIGRMWLLYQIHDSDMTFTQAYIWHGFFGYTFETYHDKISDGSLRYPDLLINSTRIQLYGLYAMVGDLDNIHAVVETSVTALYMFWFGASLGGTPSIKSAIMDCTGTFSHAIAYDGPPVDLLLVDSLLVRLQEWPCGYAFNETGPSETLRGSIGDLTMLLVVDITESPYYYFRVQLEHVYLSNQSNSFFTDVFTLDGNSVYDITLSQNTTSFQRVRVNTDPRRFVRARVTYLSFKGYTHSRCNYGGIFIYSSRNGSMESLVGSLCSERAARQWERLYGWNGITLGRSVLIVVKQYRGLSEVNAALKFQIDDCLGLVNYLPTHAFPYDQYIDSLGTSTIKEYKHYQHGINHYYRWHGKPILGIKRSSDFCLKLQYTQFNHHPLETNTFFGTFGNHNTSIHTTVHIGSMETMASSKFSAAFISTDAEVLDHYNCWAQGMRFFPDSRNDEPFVFLLSTTKEAWATVTFSVKLGLNLACLLLESAFYVKVESAKASASCFSEVGGYLYDFHYPILPQGVCVGFPVHTHVNVWRRLSLQRPGLETDCCRFDVILNSSTVPCMERAFIQQISDNNEDGYVIQRWDMRENMSEVVVWHGSCTTDMLTFESRPYIKTCIDIEWHTQTSCDVMVYYYTSFLISTPNKIKLSTDSDPRHLCYQQSCYYIPDRVSWISWEEAEASCNDMNSSLVSVNSDAEWTILTQNNLFQASSTQLFYIGYKKRVSIIFYFDGGYLG